MVLLRSATLAALAVVAPVSRAAYTLTTAYEGSTFVSLAREPGAGHLFATSAS